MSTPRSIDLLLEHAFVVTFDDDRTVHRDGALAVHDGAIVAIGDTADLRARFSPAARRDLQGRIVMPGLVDAHLHTAQTMMRGLISTLRRSRALRVPTWREYLVPFEAALSEDDVELSGLLAYSAMLATGTTTFFEAGGPHPEAMARAAWRTGIRGSVSVSTMDGGGRIPGSMQQTTERALQQNIDVVEALPSAADGSIRVTGGMSLRQIIACSTPLVVDVHREARERGVKVHTHLVEGTYEIDYALENFGHRPVEYLESIGVFTPALHGAHSVLVGDDDITAFARAGVSAAHCAKGNFGIGPAPAVRMWRRGVDIGLGTDGVASLGTLDLFRVAMIARVGQQLVEGVHRHNRNEIDPAEPLEMAVRGGAQAMGLGAVIGSLETGKRADLVVISMDSPDAAGYDSEESFLYECASGRDVVEVYVEGAQVVSDGRVTTVDAADISARARRRQRELADVIA
ncbi:amidohydrolase family protein [Microbacterium sp. CIAB417]|uniref:amidohydrolase family protein n=1 Tax=Microbacterium sp. CIAB417 TaxID=2860287 RepID=UPI001FAC82C0|nr:amidohydrolase family protein [Microbacterium sp. CIAB417]